MLFVEFLKPFLNRVLKVHDTCGVFSLHAIPGLIAALLGAIFACCANYTEYNTDLYVIYRARTSDANPDGRSSIEQAGFQLIGLVVTLGVAFVSGALTGVLLRLPVFEQLSVDVEMFDDEAQWVTPDDYALKLTFASSNAQQPAAASPAAPAAATNSTPAAAPAEGEAAKTEDSKV